MKPAHVVYEVTLTIDPARLDEFDAWLTAHIEHMLALPMFTGANLFHLNNDDGTPARCVHYLLDSDADLQTYFEEHAEHMRADGVQRFGNAMRASRRILHPQAN